MKINPVEMIALDRLRPNPENPKKPLGSKYSKGLKASLETYGFSSVLVVAENNDGTYGILDANTRFDHLNESGYVGNVPCVVVADLGGDPADEKIRNARKLFALTFDRHRKLFDEGQVAAQLKQLSAAGMAAKKLTTLAGVKMPESKLNGSTAGILQAGRPQGSLILYGPADEIARIKGLIKTIRGSFSSMEKVATILTQAKEYLDWSDEKILSILLATLAKYQDGFDG